MPLFDFECKDCGFVEEFLVLQGKEPKSCNKCKSSKLKKLISAPNLSFHGDGFYETEHGRQKHNRFK